MKDLPRRSGTVRGFDLCTNSIPQFGAPIIEGAHVFLGNTEKVQRLAEEIGQHVGVNEHAKTVGRGFVGITQPAGAMQQHLGFAGAGRTHDEVMAIRAQFDNGALLAGQLAVMEDGGHGIWVGQD